MTRQPGGDMESVEELVQLPDPDVQPLVHPLDLPEARPSFRAGWLIGVLAGPPIAVLGALVAGYLSQNYVAPVLAGFALLGAGALASRCLINRAWDHIPRKRQDRARPLPASWELGASAALALVLGVVLLLVVYRLDDADVPIDVRRFTFGMCAVAALFVLGDAVQGAVRPRTRRRALVSLPGVAVVVVATALAYTSWFGPGAAAGAANLWWGALTMAVAGAVAGAQRWWASR